MAGVDPSCELLACEYLGGQLRTLMRELVGVRRHEEIEPVHKARVASRRLRAALQMFADCFDARKVTRWEKHVKRLTRELGDARDKDVQIEFLEGFLEEQDQDARRVRPGIERLLLRWRQRREAMQPDITAMLDKQESAGILVQMYGEIEKGVLVLRSREVAVGSPAVYRMTADHVRRRLDGLLACAPSLDDPEDVDGHHRMRIAAKKLRYTLEISSAAYETQLEPFIDAAKEVQAVLGDAHDCDVWIQDVEAFLEQERLATIRYFGHDRSLRHLKPGVLAICDDRRVHRKQVFGKVLKYWEDLEANRLWESLRHAMEVRLQASDHAREGAREEPYGPQATGA